MVKKAVEQRARTVICVLRPARGRFGGLLSRFAPCEAHAKSCSQTFALLMVRERPLTWSILRGPLFTRKCGSARRYMGEKTKRIAQPLVFE